jgi:hypothetical protein
MAPHLADPHAGADKALSAAFIGASVIAHASLVVIFALVGGGGDGGARGDTSAASPSPTSPAETEVLQAEEEDSARVDELAGKAAAAAAQEAPAKAEPTKPTEIEPEPAPRPPPSASAPPRPTSSPKSSAPPRASATASAAGSSSAAAPQPSASSSAGSTGPGIGPDDGDGHAKKAPDLAQKFTKDLPSVAAGVEGWTKLPDGPAGSVKITLLLDEKGKVVKDRDPIPSEPAPPPELAESVRRTAKSLFVTLALPGHPVRAGKLTLTVSARVQHGPARPEIQKFRIESNFSAKRGDAEFELESGLKVSFDVKVDGVVVD